MFYRINYSDRVVNLSQAVEIYVETNDFSNDQYEIVANFSADGRRSSDMRHLYGGTQDECSLEFERIMELLWRNNKLIEAVE